MTRWIPCRLKLKLNQLFSFGILLFFFCLGTLLAFWKRLWAFFFFFFFSFLIVYYITYCNAISCISKNVV
jgi:hypothetical protein